MLICPLRQSVAQLPLWSLYHMTSLKIKPQWSCSLCTARLPTLSRHDRLQAIKQHIAECQKGETPMSLFNRTRTHVKKPQVAELQTKKFDAKRRKMLRGHAPVKVVPTEWNKTKRGNLHYCSKCLSKIEKGNKNHNWDLTCRQHLLKQEKKEDRYCGITTAWWTRLQKQQPLHAANFAEAVGKSFVDEITATFAKSSR